jgi:hypothetical protein
MIQKSGSNPGRICFGSGHVFLFRPAGLTNKGGYTLSAGRSAFRLLRLQIICKALFSIFSIRSFNPVNPITYLPFEQVLMGTEEKSLNIARFVFSGRAVDDPGQLR